MYSVGRGISRWSGPTQWPTTPAPSMSPTKLVAIAIPNEKRGAGAAAAVDFHEFLFAIAGDLNFVLQNSSRPEHAHDVSLLRLAESDGKVGRILSEIARRSCDLELLAIASGKDFDFGADRALVVVQVP